MTMRPVGNKVDEDSGLCTVTSLLGIIDAKTQDTPSIAAPSPPQQAPPQPPKLGAVGGRSSRARRQQLVPHSAPAEEDTRDLDELLRELGEAPKATAAKSKTKTKDKIAVVEAASLCQQQQQQQHQQQQRREQQRQEQWEQRGREQAQQQREEQPPSKRTASPPNATAAMAPQAAVLEVDMEVSQEEWQTVVRGGAKLRRAVMGSTTSDTSADKALAQCPPQERNCQRSPAGCGGKRTDTARGGITECARRGSGGVAAAVETESTPDKAVQLAGVVAPSVDAAILSTAADLKQPALPTDTLEELKGSFSSSSSSSSASGHWFQLGLSKSDSALPDLDMDVCSDIDESPSTYNQRPSVATWLSRPYPLPWVKTELDSKDKATDASIRSSSAEAVRSATESRTASDSAWHKCPSVGSWLRPAKAHVDTPKELFLPTPESTPPASPRPAIPQVMEHGIEVVWMPVPLHLVGQVQQVLCRGVSVQ